MRVLIADSSWPALDRLRLSLECIPGVEVVGAVTGEAEACRAAQALRPDACVIDLSISERRGHAIARELRHPSPSAIIFVGQQREEAAGAFDVEALDCLVKPFSFDRLQQAIERARRHIFASNAVNRLGEIQQHWSSSPDQISPFRTDFWVKARDGLVRKTVDELITITAEGDYVVARFGETSHLLNTSMRMVITELDPSVFRRVHRGWIVNLGRVRSLKRRGAKLLALTLTTGETIPVGSLYAADLLAALETRRWRTCAAD